MDGLARFGVGCSGSASPRLYAGGWGHPRQRVRPPLATPRRNTLRRCTVPGSSQENAGPILPLRGTIGNCSAPERTRRNMTGQLDLLLLRLQGLLDARAAGDATDGQLLRRFAGGQEDAFAALLQRHGPMVWGVCRR